MAFGSISAALNIRLGDDKDCLGFQAFVTQLTWPAIATPECMRHASTACTKVTSRMEARKLGEVRAWWASTGQHRRLAELRAERRRLSAALRPVLLAMARQARRGR